MIPDGYERCTQLEATLWFYEGQLYIDPMGGPDATPLHPVTQRITGGSDE